MQDRLSLGNLEILLQHTSASLTILWRGEADERSPVTNVRPFLDKGSANASAEKLSIVIDLTELEFMNSSCIGLLTNFLKSLDIHDLEVEVVFDTNKTWQVLTRRCTEIVFSRRPNITISDKKKVS